MQQCETCSHEWHGLPCRHDAVVRDGWWLVRQRCECGPPETGPVS